MKIGVVHVPMGIVPGQRATPLLFILKMQGACAVQGPPPGGHSSSLALGAEKGADWLERAQLTCVSLLAVARRFACCAPPTFDSRMETKPRTDRVALPTFAAGTDPLAAAFLHFYHVGKRLGCHKTTAHS